jgi:hypothetical protein
MKKVVIKKQGSKICADPVDQCGSPRIGLGDTPFEALVDLLRCNEQFGIDVTEEEETPNIDDFDVLPENRPLTQEEVADSGEYDDLLEFLELANIEPKFEVTGNVWRFRENKIIRYLLDYQQEGTLTTHGSGRGLNLIHDEALEKEYTTRDFIELDMAMGYSLCGFEEIFGDFMNEVLRIRYDQNGEFIDKLGATEETIKSIDEPAVRRC